MYFKYANGFLFMISGRKRLTRVWSESLMSSVVPLVPWHIAISASRQSNNQQLECNEAEFEELEVIWPITGFFSLQDRHDWYEEGEEEWQTVSRLDLRKESMKPKYPYFGHCLSLQAEVTNAIAANFKSSSKHHGSVGCTVNSLYTPTPNACAKL